MSQKYIGDTFSSSINATVQSVIWAFCSLQCSREPLRGGGEVWEANFFPTPHFSHPPQTDADSSDVTWGSFRIIWEFFLIRCEVLGQGRLCVQIVKHSETNL